MTAPDLNALLKNIVDSQAEVASATTLLGDAQAYVNKVTLALSNAQREFDCAVAAARGLPPPPDAGEVQIQALAEKVAAGGDPLHNPQPGDRKTVVIEGDTFPITGPIPMGPLPPTSPARKDMLPIAADTGPEDDRPDEPYAEST